MKLLPIFLLLCMSLCCAEEVVVLTQTPVATFCLPDGSVLTNAYAWKRSSAGVMIIHDGGSHFLNFDVLPFNWKKAYGLVPADAVDPGATNAALDADAQQALGGVYMSDEEAAAYIKQQQQNKFDADYVGETLRRISALPRQSIRYFSSTGYDGSVDEMLFTACVCQNMLDNNLREANRFYEKLKERFPESKLDSEVLYPVCERCAGEKVLRFKCSACGGTGKCAKCDGTGKRESGFKNVSVPCSACRSTGKCPVCGGSGERVRQCPDCKGRGRIFARDLCEEGLREAVDVLVTHYTLNRVK